MLKATGNDNLREKMFLNKFKYPKEKKKAINIEILLENYVFRFVVTTFTWKAKNFVLQIAWKITNKYFLVQGKNLAKLQKLLY